jgi:uncharacterized protein YjdB
MTWRLSVFLVLISSCQVFSQDLFVEAYLGPTTFDEHELFSEDFIIKNEGIIGVTDNNVAHAYLSTDQTLSYGDEFIGTTGYIDDFGPNESKTVRFQYYAVDVEPGVYYLIVDVDAYETIAETDEENNVYVVSQAITVNPANLDFHFASISADAIQLPNDIAKMSAVLANDGTTNFGSEVCVQFFISTDATLSSDDIQFDATCEAQEGSVSPYLGTTLPGLTPGNYYFIVLVDPENHYAEIDETNNVIVSDLFELSDSDLDLEFSETHTLDVEPSHLTWFFDIKNNGTTPSSNVDISVYLSADQNFYVDPYANPWEQTGDILIGTTNGSMGFSPSPFILFGHFLTYPPPGNYYLIMIIDPDEKLSETNRGNNIYVTPEPVYFLAGPGPYINMSAEPSAVSDADDYFEYKIVFKNEGPPLAAVILYDQTIKDQAGNVVASEGGHQWTVGLATEQSDFFFNYFYFYDQGPLPAGNYTLEITSASEWLSNSTVSVPFTVLSAAPTYTVTGQVKGEDGTPITAGNIFLYKKELTGKVHLVEKRALSGSGYFSFEVDEKEHTLYVIPDRLAFPDYVPTILGKTVILQPTSFFTTTEPVTVNMEVLKIQPLPSGPMSVSGNVVAGSKNAAARIGVMTGGSIEGFPVILLSNDGIPLMTTLTDGSGNYTFANLPQGNYQIVVAFELDYPLMEEPLVVDVTTTDAVADLDFTTGEPVTTIMHTQDITFPKPSQKIFGDEPSELTATTTSGLPVSFLSSDEQVAKIENGKIVIVSAGQVSITARQSGDESYLPADDITWQLTIEKRAQEIDAVTTIEKSFGDADFTIDATINTNRPITFLSSDPAVVAVDNGLVKILAAGAATISLTEPGDNNYLSVTHDIQVTVKKKQQSIDFPAISERSYGDEDFELNVSTISSFPLTIESSDEEIASVTGTLVKILKPGEVVITASLAGDDNHEATTTARTLIIGKAPQEITFHELPEFVHGNNITFTMFAGATSLLPVTFTSDNADVASVQNNILKIEGPGEAQITATQSGNELFKAAPAVVRSVKVHVITDMESGTNRLKIFPNPARDFLTVEGVTGITHVEVVDLAGKLQTIELDATNTADISKLSAGMFFLRARTASQQITLKFIKQ